MLESRAAHRYALALFRLGQETNQLEALGRDLGFLGELLRSSKELVTFLKSPVVNREKKKNILNELLRGKVSEPVFLFIRLLAQKNREGMLATVISQFNILLDEEREIIPVTIRTASPFSAEQQLKLKEQFQQLIKKTPRFHFIEDAALKGGFALQYGDTVWDGSILRQLEQLRRQFLR